MKNELEKLQSKIRTMSPAEQLRLAAALLDAAKDANNGQRISNIRIAKAVADKISDEMGLILSMTGSENAKD